MCTIRHIFQFTIQIQEASMGQNMFTPDFMQFYIMYIFLQWISSYIFFNTYHFLSKTHVWIIFQKQIFQQHTLPSSPFKRHTGGVSRWREAQPAVASQCERNTQTELIIWWSIQGQEKLWYTGRMQTDQSTWAVYTCILRLHPISSPTNKTSHSSTWAVYTCILQLHLISSPTNKTSHSGNTVLV